MRKIKRSKLLILGIFIYLLAQISMLIIGKNIETIVLKNEELKSVISTKGLIIRNEYLIKADITGKIDLLVNEKDKVKKSQEVANVYTKNLDDNVDDKIEVLNKEIEAMKVGKKNISRNDISELNKKIDEISNITQENLLKDNYENIDESLKSLDKLIDERNKLLSNGIDHQKLETKQIQKEILDKEKEDNTYTSVANISGIVSYKFDGNENKYTYENLDKITKEDIEKANNDYKEVSISGESVKENDIILRVVDNYSSYIAISVNEKQASNFQIDKVIRLKNNDEEIEGEVYKIYPDDKDFIAILKISSQNIGIYDTRVKEFDIIYKQMEGLKIPKSAIKTVDKKQGVYVVDEQTQLTNFTQIKGIVHEDDDFVFVDYYKNDINGIKSVNLHDKIILKPNIINKNMKIK